MKKVITIILCSAMILSSLLYKTPAVHGATMESSAGVVTTASYSLNIRSGMSTSSTILSTAKKGSYLTLLQRNGQWWKVEYSKGKYGYCYAEYITPTDSVPASVNTKSMDLNVRSGAGLSYARIGSLPKGEIVIILLAQGEWCKILYNGNRVGFVSAQYLRRQSTGVSAVALNVPDFKQTDSRWKNEYIGTSGKTIGQIGCATTAIAMMESYRTGTTIYPNDMAKRLRYTSSGNVYWPSDYVVVTNNTNLTGQIKNILDSGKPVLIGGRTPGGSQHWVVVTGYTNSGTLDSADFTINDPGSNTTTSLKQFLDKYSVFYKYFYYN